MDGRRARIVLGVGNDAGPTEIRRAFRAQALVTHPDHGGTPVAFGELVAALDTLGDQVDQVENARSAPAIRVHVPVALPSVRAGIDAYDSPRRPAPARAFADVLQAATARLH